MTDEIENLPEDAAPEDAALVAPDEGLPTIGPIARVREFPQTPGVYLMKDSAGRVIYVGKAKNLRARAGSYFLKAAAEDRRTADLVREIADIDFIAAESEVDALLVEARLIKDVQPKFNQDLKNDKTFSISGDHDAGGFSPRRVHAHAARARHEAVRPVRQRRQSARSNAGAAKDFQISHLHPGHRRTRGEMALVSALLAGLDRSVFGALQSADLEGRLSPRHPPAEDVLGGQQEAAVE